MSPAGPLRKRRKPASREFARRTRKNDAGAKGAALLADVRRKRLNSGPLRIEVASWRCKLKMKRVTN
jgi:hypothetical protein